MNFKGCRKKPGPNCGFSQAARPVGGAEVLVAVRGPSPLRGGREKVHSACDFPVPCLFTPTKCVCLEEAQGGQDPTLTQIDGKNRR